MGYKEGWVYAQMNEIGDVKFRDRVL